MSDREQIRRELAKTCPWAWCATNLSEGESGHYCDKCALRNMLRALLDEVARAEESERLIALAANERLAKLQEAKHEIGHLQTRIGCQRQRLAQLDAIVADHAAHYGDAIREIKQQREGARKAWQVEKHAREEAQRELAMAEKSEKLQYERANEAERERDDWRRRCERELDKVDQLEAQLQVALRS